MSDYTFRRDLEDYGNYFITDQLESNLTSWLSWSFLGIKAFDNISLNETAANGGDKSRLYPLNDPRYTTRTIWQGYRSDWCWETGVENSTQPIDISGVWVNSTFYPTTGSSKPHYINYPNGQVVFSSALPATSVVQIEYSPKLISIRKSDDAWFRGIMFGTLNPADPQFSASNPSGQWTQLPENRVTLPVIVVEPTFKVSSKPLELGGSARVRYEDFLLHVISESRFDRNTITNILEDQKDKRIMSFDKNEIDYPLDYRGSPVPSAMTYPELCDAHPWLQIRIEDSQTTSQQQIGKVWWSTCRLTLGIDGA